MQCVQQNSKVSLNNFSNFESEFNAKMNTPKADFLQCQIWIVNYNVKNQSKKNLSNENMNTGDYVVFKTKCEWKCQNKLFCWKHHFLFSLLIIFDGIFDRILYIIIDNPYLMQQKDSAKKSFQYCFLYQFHKGKFTYSVRCFMDIF